MGPTPPVLFDSRNLLNLNSLGRTPSRESSSFFYSISRPIGSRSAAIPRDSSLSHPAFMLRKRIEGFFKSMC